MDSFCFNIKIDVTENDKYKKVVAPEKPFDRIQEIDKHSSEKNKKLFFKNSNLL